MQSYKKRPNGLVLHKKNLMKNDAKMKAAS